MSLATRAVGFARRAVGVARGSSARVLRAVAEVFPGLQGRPLPRGVARSPWTSSTLVASLTPEQVTSYLAAANRGDVAQFARLCREVQDRDTHLVSVLGTRKRAVANLKWRLKPASDAWIDRLIAEWCEAQIRAIDNLEDGFLDLLDAIMTGFAAVEINWQKDEEGRWLPRHLEHRPSEWLRPSEDDPETWHLLDPSNPLKGVPLQVNQWIVHTARAKAGYPHQAGLGRVLIWWYLFKAWNIRYWVAYNEKYGAPLRLGKYPATAQDDAIDALDLALQQLGLDASAVIPADMQVDFIGDKGGRTGADTYERIIIFGNREMSKAVVGQTLTTEESAKGTQALGNVQDEVRRDIRDSDALQLARTLRRDLLGPLVRLNFGATYAIPGWEFDVEPPADEEVRGRVQESRGKVFAQAVELGVPVAVSQVRDELELRVPEAGEPTLGGTPRAPVPGPRPPFRARAGSRVRPLLLATDRGMAPAADFERLLVGARPGLSAAWSDVVAALQAALSKALPAHAEAVVSQALREAPIEAYAEELARATLTAEALGTLQVRNGDRRTALPVTDPLGGDAEGWAAAMGTDVDRWNKLVQRHAREATETANYAALRLAEELVAALDDPGLGDDAVTRVEAASETARTDTRRTDSVLETSAAVSWGRGRADQQQREVSRRPYYRYRTMEDKAVRPAHAAMNDRVYPADHPIWQTWNPPNGWNCRCWRTAHTYEEVIANGWEIAEDWPVVEVEGGKGEPGVPSQPAVPDLGWQRDHLRQAHEYDWSAFPESWKLALNVEEEAAA